MLSRLRIENLVLIRDAELAVRARPERDHGRDRGRQDDPRPGVRPAPRRRRAMRATSVRPATTPMWRPSSTCPPTSSPTTAWRRSWSFAPPTRTGSCSRGACSATAGRARMRGVARRRVRTWPARPSACSPCPASSSSAASRARRTSSTSSTPSPARSSCSAAASCAWPGASSLAARRRHDELTRDAAAADARLAELKALVEDAGGYEPGLEDALRAERERFRHAGELVEATSAAVAALDPEDGEGAADLIASAERSVAGVERLAPELGWAGDELRDVELRLREAASALRTFLASARRRPGPCRGGRVAARSDRGREAPVPMRELRRAAGARGGCESRSSRRSAKAATPPLRQPRRLSPPRRAWPRSHPRWRSRDAKLRDRSPTPSRRSWPVSAWGRASSASSSASGRTVPGRPAPTRSCS